METPTIRTREDLAKLLASLGKPGENQDAKIEAVKKLNIKNKQGHGVELTLESYKEF